METISFETFEDNISHYVDKASIGIIIKITRIMGSVYLVGGEEFEIYARIMKMTAPYRRKQQIEAKYRELKETLEKGLREIDEMIKEHNEKLNI